MTDTTTTTVGGAGLTEGLARSLLAALTPGVVRKLTTRELTGLAVVAEADGEVEKLDLINRTLVARQPTDQGFVYTGKLAQEVALEQGLHPTLAKGILEISLTI